MADLADRLKREIDLTAHLKSCGVEVRGGKARCPFHNDQEASLSVGRKGGCWVLNCFGCGFKGTVIDFEVRRQGIPVGEAIKCLGEKYGLSDDQGRRGIGGKRVRLAPVEIFKEAITRLYGTARANFAAGKVPEARAYLEARGISFEAAVQCGIGAARLSKRKYGKMKRWLLRKHGVGPKALGLSVLFPYARHELAILVYPYWPGFEPPDPTGSAGITPPLRYVKFRPCLSRGDAQRLGVAPHLRPKGHECSDPWCPVGLPEEGGALWLLEGETDCLTAVDHGAKAAAMPGAGARLPKRFLAVLRERKVHVHLVADADEAGERMLAARTRELLQAGVEVKPLRLPVEVEGKQDWGKDLNDLLLTLPEENRGEWPERLVPVEPEKLVPPVPSGADSLSAGHVAICVTELQPRAMVVRSWEALLRRNDPPRLFRQGEDLAYLGVDPKDMDKPDAERKPAILPVTEVVMNGMLLRAADWVRLAGESYKPSKPPWDVSRDMVHYRPLPGWLPPLESVISAPSYGPDLDWIAPGYHRDMRLAYMPSLEIAPPENPSPAQLAEALRVLDHLLVDFPFKDPSDRANYIGVLLLALLRPAIRGNTPLVAVVSPIQRSGKGTLCAILEILMTGTNASAAQYSPDPEEFRKALLPYVSRGQPIIRLDNVDDGSEVRSPHLASALTEGWYCDRVLGHSETRSVPVRSIFLTTGNNIRISRDLLYRTLWVRLAPETDEPDKRPFAIDEIEEHVKARRAEYLTVLATLVEHWKAKGAKPWTGRRWNSFNPFLRTVGGVLEACGIEGFLANAEEQRAEGNPAESEWRRVLQCWSERAEGLFKSAGWLLEQVFNPCEPLAYIRIRGHDEKGRARSLSRLLGKEVGRPRALRDGRAVFIERGRDLCSKVDTYGLVAHSESGGYGYNGGPEELSPYFPPAEFAPGRGDSGYNGDNGYNPYPTRVEPAKDEEEERTERVYSRSRELSPVCPLYPSDLSQQGLMTRVKHGDSERPHDYTRSRPSAPSPSPSRLPEPADVRCEIFEERAAIMEFEGGLDREQAERAAGADIRRRQVGGG